MRDVVVKKWDLEDTINAIYQSKRLRTLAVKVVNTFVPQYIVTLQPNAFWRRHKNGEGWVSSSALVAPTAYVGYNACVYDNAWIGGYARIEGWACVLGSAVVNDNARICDNARVMGTATVVGQACVCHSAVLFDAHVAGDQFVMIGQIKPGGVAL